MEKENYLLYENKIIELLKQLCPDFNEYIFKAFDLYKGSLLGKYNVYYKKGVNNTRGLVTGVENIKEYHLDKFPYNFETENQINGKIELGWSGQILIDLLNYLISIKNLEYENTPRVNSKEDWVLVLNKELELEKNNKKTFLPYLRYLLNEPNYSKQAELIAKQFHEKVSVINSRLRSFGKRIVALTGIEEQKRTNNTDLRYWNIPFKGKYLPNGYFEYTLREELIEALNEVDIEEPVFNEENIFEKTFLNMKSDETDFNKMLKQINEIVINGEKVRKEFISKFNLDFIKNEMILDDYVTGSGNKESFCNYLESRLKSYGGIQGSPAIKFGIYKEKETQNVRVSKIWIDEDNNIDKAFIDIKKEILSLLEYGKNKDYEKIEHSKLSPMFKGKILAMYYPENYLCIFKEEHVDKFISALKITYDPSVIKTIEQKKKLLKEYQENHYFFKNYSSYFFVLFLYQPIFKELILGLKNQNKEINHKEIELVNWKYLESILPSSKAKSTKRKADYIKAAVDKQRVGEYGEMAILRYEKDRLNNIGRADLSLKVKKVSGTDGDDSLGYDIHSYDIIDGEVIDLYIEVKSTVKSHPVLEFYLTSNEYEKYLSNENHKIYYLFDIYNSPKLHIVDRKQLVEKYLQTVLYKVKIRVEDLSIQES